MAFDPTAGFKIINEWDFVVQGPHNVKDTDRHKCDNGEHKMWVSKTDKPYSKKTNTKPRTEIRIRTQGYNFINYEPGTEIGASEKHNFTHGVWQFEGQGYVPEGRTSGACIMQILGMKHSDHSTKLQIRTYKGSLWYYREKELVPNIYGKWFQLNAIYDVTDDKVKVYIDKNFMFEEQAKGKGDSYYFQCGVYAEDFESKDDCSDKLECHWKKIRILKKNK